MVKRKPKKLTKRKSVYKAMVIFIVLALLSVVLWPMMKSATGPEVVVYKSPTCGCCRKWVSYLRSNGFNVTQIDTHNIQKVKKNNPVGLLLIPFKKGHWDRVIQIIDETALPSVILATLGILLAPHIRQAKYRSGVYLINSLDNLDAVENGMRMIQANHRMNNSVIINITGEETIEQTVPIIGTTVRTIPHQSFYDVFKEFVRHVECPFSISHFDVRINITMEIRSAGHQ